MKRTTKWLALLAVVAGLTFGAASAGPASGIVCNSIGPLCGGIPCSPVAETPWQVWGNEAVAVGHTTGCAGYTYYFSLRLEDNQGHHGASNNGSMIGNWSGVGPYEFCYGPRLVRSHLSINVNGQTFESYSPYMNCTP